MIKIYEPRSILSMVCVPTSVHRVEDTRHLFVTLSDHNIEIAKALDRGAEIKRNDYFAAKSAMVARHKQEIAYLKKRLSIETSPGLEKPK